MATKRTARAVRRRFKSRSAAPSSAVTDTASALGNLLVYTASDGQVRVDVRLAARDRLADAGADGPHPALPAAPRPGRRALNAIASRTSHWSRSRSPTNRCTPSSARPRSKVAWRSALERGCAELDIQRFVGLVLGLRLRQIGVIALLRRVSVRRAAVSASPRRVPCSSLRADRGGAGASRSRSSAARLPGVRIQGT